MIFIVNLKGVCMKIATLYELRALASNSKEFLINYKLTKRQLHQVFFDHCSGCKTMAVVPQGAFLARKFREMKERQFMMMEMNDSEERDRENRRSGNCGGDGTWYNKNSTEGRELTPVKYNSKLMNSIWGLYNRYSPHNFKKNTDANQRMIAPIWERTLLSAVAMLPQFRRQSKS